MVSLRLKRLGSKKRPCYRLVVAEKSNPLPGAVLEELGQYRPIEEENQFSVKKERVEYWLKNGAECSATVKRLLNKSDIQIVRR